MPVLSPSHAHTHHTGLGITRSSSRNGGHARYRLFHDLQVDQRRQHAEQDRKPPHWIVGTGAVEDAIADLRISKCEISRRRAVVVVEEEQGFLVLEENPELRVQIVALRAYSDGVDIARLRFEGEMSVRKVLTPEQLVKFRGIREQFAQQRRENMQNRRNRRDGRGGPAFAPRRDAPPNKPIN